MYVVRQRNKCSRYFHSPLIPWYRVSGKLHIMCIFLSLSRIHVQTPHSGTWERGLQTCERCLGTYERGKRSLWILIFVPNRCSNSVVRVGSNSATREKQQAHKARPKNQEQSWKNRKSPRRLQWIWCKEKKENKRETDRQTDREKMFKNLEDARLFSRTTNVDTKAMVLAQLPLPSFHLFSPLHLSLLLPFASPRGRRNASLIKASVDTGENAIWIIIERLCMQRRKVADSPLFVKYNFEGSLTGGSLDFLRDAGCFASSRIDFARRLFNFRV